MARVMRREKWPVSMRLHGGRVIHYARLLADSETGVYRTACGKTGKPGTEGGIPNCAACAALPWSQDQRSTST